MVQPRRSARLPRQSNPQRSEEEKAPAPKANPAAPKRVRTAQEAAKEAAYKSGAQRVPEPSTPATKVSGPQRSVSKQVPRSAASAPSKSQAPAQTTSKTNRPASGSASKPINKPVSKPQTAQSARPSVRPASGRDSVAASTARPAIGKTRSSAPQPTQQKQQAKPRPQQQSKSAPARSASSRSSVASGVGNKSTSRSGRQSARIETKGGGGKLLPFIVVLLLAGVGVGAWFSMQGEDLSFQITVLENDYAKALKNLESALDTGPLDSANEYFDKGISALDQLDAYVNAHAAEIPNPPDTNSKRTSITAMHDRLPLLQKIYALRENASEFQKQLHHVKKLKDLDRLSAEIKDFIEHPKVDGADLDADALKYFQKQVSYLDNADKLINDEKERRQNRLVKPTYKEDTRNDLQRRADRSAYQSLASNVPHKLEQNKFSDAYKTAEAYHTKYPLFNIDEDWEKIVAAEDAYWKTNKAEIEKLLNSGKPADKQAAANKLSIFFDLYGNEDYGDEARDLYLRATAP